MTDNATPPLPRYLMRLTGTADFWLYFEPPLYLSAWNPATGGVVLTGEIALAHQFHSINAVFDTWKFVDQARPFRPDGEPNRPLTSFNMEPIPHVPQS